jgi:fatty acid/phospholipid biosynthesis enzyme
MKTIVINLGLKAQGINDLKQVLKVFAHHNPLYNIICVGNEKDNVSLKETQGIKVIDMSQNGTDEDYLNEAIKQAKTLNAEALLTFGSREEIAKKAEEEFTSICDTKAYALLYSTKVFNKATLLLDCGINNTLDEKKISDLYHYGYVFLRKVVGLRRINFSCFDNYDFSNIKLEDGTTNLGVTSYETFLNGTSDLIITDSRTANIVISTARGTFSCYNAARKVEIDKSVFFKFGNWLLKDVNKFLGNTFDYNMISNGYFLLGYSTQIFALNEGVKYGNFMQSLNFAKNLIERNYVAELQK